MAAAVVAVAVATVVVIAARQPTATAAPADLLPPDPAVTAISPAAATPVSSPQPVPHIVVTVPDLPTPSSLQTLAIPTTTAPPGTVARPATRPPAGGTSATATTTQSATGSTPPRTISRTTAPVARPPARPAHPGTTRPVTPPPTTPLVVPTQYRHPLGWVSGGKVVSLTFDDGPSPYTNRVLDLLDRYHVKATFCQIGEQVGAYPQVEARIASDGHTLCDHTWTHDEALPARSITVINSEISRTQAAIKAATGLTPAYYRAPGGDFGTTAKLPDRLAAFHTVPLAWAVDSNDWKRPGIPTIVKNVVSAVTPGAIILMHDGGGDRSQTLAALPKIITALRAAGYAFEVLPRSPTRH